MYSIRMSAAKLTLKLEKSAIRKAKTYAKANRTSLSRMVESYFNGIAVASGGASSPKISPIVRSLSGILKNKEIDYKKEMTKILSEKHGIC